MKGKLRRMDWGDLRALPCKQCAKNPRTNPVRRSSALGINRDMRHAAYRGFLHWRLSNAGPGAFVRAESSVMGPASETRHKSSPADDVVHTAEALRKQTKSLQRRERRKCATSGPEHAQQESRYLITSSAQPSSDVHPASTYLQ